MTDELVKQTTSQTEGITTDAAPPVIQLPDVAKMEEAFKTLAERQDNFKRLILSRLVEGRDYGFPPGCEQKYDSEGNILQYDKRSGKWATVPKTQWQAKPSLYVSGALELRDLFKMLNFPVRPQFERTWNGQIAQSRCQLIQENTGHVVGEGVGASAVGKNGMDENGALQMADHRAFKAAVRRTFPCCTAVFTQDQEDNDKPKRKDEAPPDKFEGLVTEWICETLEPSNPLYGSGPSSDLLRDLRRECGRMKPVPQSADAAIDALRTEFILYVDDSDGGAFVWYRRKGTAADDGDLPLD